MRTWIMRIMLLLLPGLLLLGAGEAQPIEGLPTQPCPREQAAAVAESLAVSISDREPKREGLLCMSVDAAGRVAVGSESGEQKQICVYDADMEFLFSISFKAYGSFNIVLSEDTVWVILWREALCAGISPDGTVKEVLEIPSAIEMSNYLERAVRREPQIVNGNTYALQNQKGILNLTGEYSRIVMTCADGEQKVLYDVESQMMASLILKLIGICLLLALTIVCVVDSQSGAKRERPGGGAGAHA